MVRIKSAGSVLALLGMVGVIIWSQGRLSYQAFVVGTSVPVTASVSGRVSKVFAHHGQSVKPGTPLFKLASDAYQYQVDYAAAQLQQAMEQTPKHNTQISMAKAKLKLAEYRLMQTHVHASVVGRLLEKIVHPGRYVRAGQPLAWIEEKDHPLIKASFSKPLVHTIGLKQLAYVHLANQPYRLYHAHVVALHPLHGINDTLQVHLKIDSAYPVNMPLGTHAVVWLRPLGAQ